MVKKQTLIDGVKNMTLGQALRMLGGVAASLVLAWSSSGWVVKPLAAEVFNELLVGSEEFKTLQSQTTAITNDLKGVGDDTAKIKGEMQDLQEDLKLVSEQLKGTNESIEKVEDLVGKLLTIQLQRSHTTFSPPGAGPVGLPQLGDASP